MSGTAFLFPGQGAQYVGMGRDFYEHYPAARAVFDAAAAVFGDELLRVIFSGPEEALLLTENTQPAILTVSMAVFKVLEEAGCRPRAVAGLSLGEYSALVAAGALRLEQALPLVQKRGRFMQEAVPAGEGSMAAILGLEREAVEAACREAAKTWGVVSPANYNCPGQIVISGRVEAVEQAAALARQAGAKKITALKVSAPFHCALLAPVEAKLERELAAVEMKPPAVPVVLNVSARAETDPARIMPALVRQVSSPILWEQSVQTLLETGCDTFIDVGPGRSLAKLIKRIDPAVRAAAVEDLASLEQAINLVKGVS